MNLEEIIFELQRRKIFYIQANFETYCENIATYSINYFNRLIEINVIKNDTFFKSEYVCDLLDGNISFLEINIYSTNENNFGDEPIVSELITKLQYAPLASDDYIEKRALLN